MENTAKQVALCFFITVLPLTGADSSFNLKTISAPGALDYLMQKMQELEAAQKKEKKQPLAAKKAARGLPPLHPGPPMAIKMGLVPLSHRWQAWKQPAKKRSLPYKQHVTPQKSRAGL